MKKFASQLTGAGAYSGNNTMTALGVTAAMERVGQGLVQWFYIQTLLPTQHVSCDGLHPPPKQKITTK